MLKHAVVWIVLGGSLLCSGREVSAASIYTETWSTAGDTRNWFIGALGGGGTPVVSGGMVNWTAECFASFGFLSGFQAQVQPSGSEGKFAGDYTAAGITALSFDLALDSDSLNNAGPPTVRILFTASVEGFNSYWLHDFAAVPIGDGFHHFTIPMQAASWTQYLGKAAFSDAIRNVMTLEVDYYRLGNYPAYVQTGRFDNFAAEGVPEPDCLVLSMLAISGISCLRRQRCVSV